MIVTKVLAGRPKDLEDVDLEYIRQTVRMLEGATGQSDLMPLFDRALDSVRRLEDRKDEDV